jgi:hypothetical protein
MNESVGTSLRTGALIAVLGALAWASGLPALFPSLGPSALVLATDDADPQQVIGGHAIGVLAGLLAYHGLASGLIVTQPFAPLSAAGARLAASGTIAIVLTVAGMLVADRRHPPACATTLIVALGLLSTVADGLLIVAAVTVLVAARIVLPS